MPTWYGDLLTYRHRGAVLVSDSDSDRVGPWTKGYLRTTTDGSGQVGNREGLLSCLTSAERWWWCWGGVLEGVLPGTGVHDSQLDSQSTGSGGEGHLWGGGTAWGGRERSNSAYRDAQTNCADSPRTRLHVHTSSPRRGLTVVLTHAVPNILISTFLREYSVPACSPMMYRKLPSLSVWLGGWGVPLTRIRICMEGSSKNSTPAQPAGMSPESSSVGVMFLWGAAHEEGRDKKGNRCKEYYRL